MPSIDVEKFLAQNGVRKSRFGGLDEDDVRAAMRTLCAEYDQRLNHVQGERQRLAQENASLVQQCRTLSGQNRMLSSQNATLAGNGEQYSRQSQELSTEVSRLQERNRSLHDQCAVLRLKNSDLQDENAALKAEAEQAGAALRLRGKELADEIAALRASRQQKLNEAAAEASATLADARTQADALLAEARAQADAIGEAARQQARAQAQNLVDAAAAEANEIQNAHQLRLNELAAEVRRMEARRARMIEYFNQVGSELLRTGTADPIADAEAEEAAAPAPLEDIAFPEITAPAVELDLSPEALAAARAPRTPAPDQTLAEDTAAPAQEDVALPPLTDAEYTAPAQELGPAPQPPHRAFTLAEEDDFAPAAPAVTTPAAEPPAPPLPEVPAVPAPEPPAPAPDAAWQDLMLDPAPADPMAGPADLWPDLAPQPAAPPAPEPIPQPVVQPAAQPAPADAWPGFGTGVPAADPDLTASAAATPWQDIGFDDAPAAALAGDAYWQDAPAAPAADDDWGTSLAAPAAGEMWQDLAPAAAPAPADLLPVDVPAPAPQTPPGGSRQTAPGLTEVPGAIFSSPIVRPEEPAPQEPAPAAAPRAPLLPGQEPEAADDEDTLSGLVAKPAAPGAGIAWQRRHKAIRAIQALRRLYR